MKQRFQIFKQALECSHEDVQLAIVLTTSIIIIHNFLIEVNDDLNDLGSHHEIDTEHDVPENRDDDDDYDGEDKDMSTHAILLRHIQYINED